MNRIVPTLLAALLLAGCQSAPTQAPSAAVPIATFGNPGPQPGAKLVSAAEVLASPASYEGQTLELTGDVVSVCTKRGCWMRVGDTGATQSVFVKFTCPIEDRLVPLDAVGKQATIIGQLQMAQISEASARHFAQDAGASPEAIAAIRGPQPMLRMNSAGARVEGLVTAAE